MTAQNQRTGILLMIATTLIFAIQDGISRHLSESYNVYMIVMIRFWFFALFVVALASRQAGGLRQAVATRQPWLQICRAVLLVSQVLIVIQGFVVLGLVETHAVFACYPLLIVALSGPVLGEKVGWRRWAAVVIGLVGIMVILQPGVGVFQPEALIPLLAALLFALYGVLTRYAARKDSTAVSFFWTGVLGALTTTAIGIWFWEPMIAPDWGWMAILCLTSASAHWLLIRAYELAEASAIQPFAYLQLVFVAILGLTIFDEMVRPNVALGAVIVVGSGLFALWRERMRAQVSAPVQDPATHR